MMDDIDFEEDVFEIQILPPAAKQKADPVPEKIEEIEELHDPPKNDDTMRLKAALYVDIGKIIEEQGPEIGDVTFSKDFHAALTETTYQFIHRVGQDLEAFAKHAARKSVRSEDAMLVGRRNESVRQSLAVYARELHAESADKAAKTKKRKEEALVKGSYAASKPPPTKKTKKIDPKVHIDDGDDF